MNYFRKLEDAAPPRRSLKAIALSFAILAALFFLNTNYAPYLTGRLVGAIDINPETVPFETIRTIGNVILFVAFMAAGWNNTWSKFNDKN